MTTARSSPRPARLRRRLAEVAAALAWVVGTWRRPPDAEAAWQQD